MSVYSSVGASDNMAAPGASVGPVQHLHGDGEVDDHDGGASAGVYGADEGTGLTSEGAGSGLGDRHHDGDDAAGLLDERIGSRWGPHKHAAPLPAAPEPVGTVDVRRSRFPYSVSGFGATRGIRSAGGRARVLSQARAVPLHATCACIWHRA